MLAILQKIGHSNAKAKIVGSLDRVVGMRATLAFLRRYAGQTRGGPMIVTHPAIYLRLEVAAFLTSI